MLLPIITAPNPVLSSIAQPIKKVNKEIRLLIAQMTETLESAKDPEGVGLAAPQVGKSIQLFMARPSKTSPLLICINPKLLPFIDQKNQANQKHPEIQKKKHSRIKLEGCLSLIDIWGEVQREGKIKLSFLDEHGKQHTKMFAGFLATIVQHEYDHLQGILFPKRVLEQKGKLYKSSKDEKGETVFEEIKI
ncbi:MAG: peptide deformylase [Candidatus Levybacteria bacterium]|nr:peptide deformylase [Candidatus Levybacteria bacterium]